ncbi:hypothetical protein E2542_SST02940 [Spatholobus suberectus]|nr:hypothetical protein E2542_SST02940 [Spatholobus suberectus]
MDHVLALQAPLLHFTPHLLPTLHLSSGLHRGFHLHRKRGHLLQSHERCSQGVEETHGHLLCTFVAFFAYNVMAFVVFIVWALTTGGRSGGVVILLVLGILYFAGFVYLTVVWHLASVVTVMEDSCGVRAMAKTIELIKGKMGLSVLIFFTLLLSFWLIQLLFKKTVVQGWRLGSVDKTAYGIVCLVLFSQLYLFQLVIQTVLYFVCKSYHHQNIDKSALSDHLEVYHGEYEPLKAKDVQMEECRV